MIFIDPTSRMVIAVLILLAIGMILSIFMAGCTNLRLVFETLYKALFCFVELTHVILFSYR